VKSTGLFALKLFFGKRGKPLSIRRVFSHMPIQVRCAVRPPNGTALPELIFYQFNSPPGFFAADAVANTHGCALLPARAHQLIDQRFF
jgi:hypothetical protein